MEVLRADDWAHGCGADAVAVDGGLRRGLELGVPGQVEVGVARQVDDFLAIHDGEGRLVARQHAQLHEAALGLELGDLGVQEIHQTIGLSRHAAII